MRTDPGFGLIDETGTEARFGPAGDKDRYYWPPQPGATSYEVARSDVPDFSGACLLVVTVDPGWSDAQQPDASAAFFYLNRALTPNAGSWGQDSSGAERASICP